MQSEAIDPNESHFVHDPTLFCGQDEEIQQVYKELYSSASYFVVVCAARTVSDLISFPVSPLVGSVFATLGF